MTSVVIEGIDLAGKSSIARALADLITPVTVIESPQPQFRALLQTATPSLSPMGRLALYISANIELGRYFRDPASLIAVRYFPSTITYHAVANQEPATDCMRELDYLISRCTLPDAMIIVEASHQDRLKRATETASPLTESDNWTLRSDIHARLTESYHEIAESLNLPSLFLDTTGQRSFSMAEVAFEWLRSLGLA